MHAIVTPFFHPFGFCFALLTTGEAIKAVWQQRAAFPSDAVPFEGRLTSVFAGDHVFRVSGAGCKAALVMRGSRLLAAADAAGANSSSFVPLLLPARPARPPAAPPPSSCKRKASKKACAAAPGGSEHNPEAPASTAAADKIALSDDMRGSLLRSLDRAWPPSAHKQERLKYLIARWMVENLQPDADLRFRTPLKDIG